MRSGRNQKMHDAGQSKAFEARGVERLSYNRSAKSQDKRVGSSQREEGKKSEERLCWKNYADVFCLSCSDETNKKKEGQAMRVIYD